MRTGLAAGGGAGAVVGLMLAFRRQRNAELATALGQLDAGERRITELYNAAERLGSDKAPVRLTALYTLERLANDNPDISRPSLTSSAPTCACPIPTSG